MCLLLLVIGILLGIVGLCSWYKSKSGTMLEDLSCIIGWVGAGLAVVAAIVLFFLIFGCSSAATVDARIEMYQEENVKIEEQIAAVVKQYQEYEKEIFTEVSPESAMTLVALYPELKADSLVASQIDIYVANNEKIKELKEESINASVIRWWTYFGG